MLLRDTLGGEDLKKQGMHACIDVLTLSSPVFAFEPGARATLAKDGRECLHKLRDSFPSVSRQRHCWCSSFFDLFLLTWFPVFACFLLISFPGLIYV